MTISKISLTPELLKESGIPERFWRLGRDNYYGAPAALKQTEKYITESAEAIKTGLGLFFSGPTDSGKSFLMVYALKCLLAKGHISQYVSLETMKDSHFEDDKDLFEQIFLEPVFLGIDNCEGDINKGHVNALIRVLRERYDANLPTLICTKLSDSDFAAQFGEASAKFVDQNSVHVNCSANQLLVRAKQERVKARLKFAHEVQEEQAEPAKHEVEEPKPRKAGEKERYLC